MSNQYQQEPTDTSPYLKLEQGVPVKVRITGPFHNFWESFQGQQPGERWAWIVIQKMPVVRVKALRVSAPAFKLIRQVALNADWGDPTGYDLTIIREGEGLNTTYTVTPSPKSPITDAEKKMLREANLDLAELFKKNTVAAPPFAQADPFEGE